MDALGASWGRAGDVVYKALHLWVARLLLHRAQLDFAREVLDEVPDAIRAEHMGFRALDRLLKAMEIAAAGRGVFPIHIDPKNYWSSSPHLEFPKDIEGRSLFSWNPARVDDVDDRTVRLVVGKRDHDADATIYGQIELPAERFDEACLDGEPKSNCLSIGRLLELAFYGPEGELRIRVHPDTPYTDPDLPFIDPPNPRRYLQREPARK